MQKLLGIVGPTAIGKTALAIKLAQKLDAQIVSGDSMQVYREVSIGTAKATPAEQKQVKHYLVDTQSIFDEYSVKMFVDDATKAIAKIGQEHHLPMLVGGTGLYVRALVTDLQLGEQQEVPTGTEAKWEEYLTKYGPTKLWDCLAQQDPAAAKKIPVQNSRRVMRALSVIDRTGKKFSEQQAEIKPRYDYLLIGLKTERAILYERINQRVDQMMDQGLLQEAEFVYHNRQSLHQVRQAIGYKEFFPYFAGTADLDSCVTKLKTASRRYAKRQLTYFNNSLPVKWFDPLQDPACEEKILSEVAEWLQN